MTTLSRPVPLLALVAALGFAAAFAIGATTKRSSGHTVVGAGAGAAARTGTGAHGDRSGVCSGLDTRSATAASCQADAPNVHWKVSAAGSDDDAIHAARHRPAERQRPAG